MKRIIQRFKQRQLMSIVCESYGDLLNEHIIQDIVSFSGLMEYRQTTEIDKDQLLIMEGRRQMALHILRHLDLSPREIVEAHNDAAIINNTVEED